MMEDPFFVAKLIVPPQSSLQLLAQLSLGSTFQRTLPGLVERTGVLLLSAGTAADHKQYNAESSGRGAEVTHHVDSDRAEQSSSLCVK